MTLLHDIVVINNSTSAWLWTGKWFKHFFLKKKKNLGRRTILQSKVIFILLKYYTREKFSKETAAITITSQ